MLAGLAPKLKVRAGAIVQSCMIDAVQAGDIRAYLDRRIVRNRLIQRGVQTRILNKAIILRRQECRGGVIWAP